MLICLHWLGEVLGWRHVAAAKVDTRCLGLHTRVNVSTWEDILTQACVITRVDVTTKISVMMRLNEGVRHSRRRRCARLGAAYKSKRFNMTRRGDESRHDNTSTRDQETRGDDTSTRDRTVKLDDTTT